MNHNTFLPFKNVHFSKTWYTYSYYNEIHTVVLYIVWYVSFPESKNILQHGLTNYINTKPKCLHLKKITRKGTLRQVFNCLRPHPFLWPPYPPHTVFVYSVYLFTQGRGRGARLEWQQFTKLGRLENTNMTDCISSLETLINNCREVPLEVNIYRWRHFFIWYLYSQLVNTLQCGGEVSSPVRAGPMEHHVRTCERYWN